MGLRRKQDSDTRESGQFDMRRTVEDFKQTVWAYSFWKPTMLIHVRHIRRKDLPNFVFPGGVWPAQLVRVAGESRVKRHWSDSSKVNVDAYEIKRRQIEVAAGVSLKEPTSFAVRNNFAYFHGDTRGLNDLTNASCQKISYDSQEVEGSVRNCQPEAPLCSGSSSSALALDEGLAIAQPSEPSISHQSVSKVLDELEDDIGLVDQVQHVGSLTECVPVQSSTNLEVPAATEASSTVTRVLGATSYKPYQDGVLEELEVLITIYLNFSLHLVFFLITIYKGYKYV